MLYAEVTVSLDDHFEDFMDVFLLPGQLTIHFQHFMDIKLCDEVGIYLANVINIVTLVASCRFHGLDSEDLVTGTLRSTPHVV